MKIYASNKHPDINDFIGRDLWVRCSAPEDYFGDQSGDFFNFTEYDSDSDRLYYRRLPAHFIDDYFQNPDQYDHIGHLWLRSHGNMSKRVFDTYYNITKPLEMYTTEELKELLGNEP